MVPRLDDKSLSPDHASYCRNVKFSSERLEGFSGPKLIRHTAFSSPEANEGLNTYFPFAPEEDVQVAGGMPRIRKPSEYDFLRFRGDVSALRGPVPSDKRYRTYFTRNDAMSRRPEMPSLTYTANADGDALAISGDNPLAYPGVSRPLGIPAPGAAPDVTSEASDESVDDVDKETRVYAYSYVSELDEEGPLSPPSAEVTVSRLDSRVGVTMGVDYDTTDNGRFVSSAVVKVRLYRAATGEQTGTNFYLVREVAITGVDTIELTGSTGDFSGDSLPSSQLGGPAVSQTWAPPPSDLHSIVNMPGGFVTGARGNQLYSSEVNLPHAWNSLLAVTLPYEIVGIGAFGVSAVAFTREDVYVISGTTPASLSTSTLNIRQGCLSRRGIISLGHDGIVFPSPDGLYHVSGAGHRNLTEYFFERNQWFKVMSPDKLVAAAHERMYYGFYAEGAANEDGEQLQNFVFDPRTDDGSGMTHLGDDALFGAGTERTLDGVYSDPLSDRLLVFAHVSAGIDVLMFDEDGAAPVAYAWHSKLFDAGRRVRFRWGRVHLLNRDVRLVVEVDGTDVDVGTISDSEVFGLPPGVNGRFFRLKLEGVGAVRDAVIAETQPELRLER